ncbi:MAG: class I SAM-dependent methyltransferase [Leptospiraceae bacterium]|nr:class I SAM-dependent methyltransferase [Leptospiraceae bacterium]
METRQRIPADQYTLLDYGNGRRLEQLGTIRIIRPAPAALKPEMFPQLWKAIDAVYDSQRAGGGSWITQLRPLPEPEVDYAGIRFKLMLAPTGQIGLFPEHRQVWNSIRNCALAYRARSAQHPESKPRRMLRVLNLFGYTGAATIAALQSGCEVCHVDAAASVVNRAKQNAALSGVAGGPVRWIVDDVLKFVRREIRRGRRYDVIIVDPPSFGRGGGTATWKIQRDLPGLLADLWRLCRGRPALFILSAHTDGLSPDELQAMLLASRRDYSRYEYAEQDLAGQEIADSIRESRDVSGYLPKFSMQHARLKSGHLYMRRFEPEQDSVDCFTATDGADKESVINETGNAAGHSVAGSYVGLMHPLLADHLTVY